MSTPTPQRARRAKGIIAGLTAGALLLTGGTWALWSDSDRSAGGDIILGNLDLEAFDVHPWDVSTSGETYNWGKRDDQDTLLKSDPKLDGFLPTTYLVEGHPIGDGWHAVPGDTVALAFPLAVTLQGDNLVATLEGSLSDSQLGPDVFDAFTLPLLQDTPAFTIEAFALNEQVALTGPYTMTWTWGQLAGHLGEPVITREPFLSALLQAPNENWGDVDPNIPVVTAPDPADIINNPADIANVGVILTLYVPNFVSQDGVTKVLATLTGIDWTLTQTRTPTIGWFT